MDASGRQLPRSRVGGTPTPAADDTPTTLNLRRALGGDADGWRQLFERLGPLIELQARYRLRGPLERLHEPADLVQDAWVVALARLGDLEPREGRLTPVLVRFLSTTVLRRVNELMRRHLGREPTSLEAVDEECLDQDVRAVTSVTAAASRSETGLAVRAALDELPEADRELIVLRGIEGVANRAVAERLGLNESAASMRYKRALERLRGSLPAGVLCAFEQG